MLPATAEGKSWYRGQYGRVHDVRVRAVQIRSIQCLGSSARVVGDRAGRQRGGPVSLDDHAFASGLARIEVVFGGPRLLRQFG